MDLTLKLKVFSDHFVQNYPAAITTSVVQSEVK